MSNDIEKLSVVYVDTSGRMTDPFPSEPGTYYKSAEYLVCVRPSFVSFWIRKTSRRYDIQGGDLQDEIAAFCAMMGDGFDDDEFRRYHRRADRAYFARSHVAE